MTSDGGTYTILVNVTGSVAIEVGALGAIAFEQGWYAYVGSALGSGGFARVERHRELASGARNTRHWHIDYLLTNGRASIERVVRTPGVDAECAIASALTAEAVPDFGCSDCSCESHLFFHRDRCSLVSSVETAHSDVQTV